jgi:ribosomal protein S18 acetylase RimI-like enzyme
MNIRAIRPSELETAYALLSSLGWSHRLRSLPEFLALIAASDRACVAVSPSGQIVGFARALTDGLSNGYLSMVVVAPEFRRQGVGRALVAEVTEGTPGVTWVLRAGREGASEFFGRLGFRPSTVAMERERA